MSGMPAFGPTHDEEKLWNITAFVKRLPEMSAEQYSHMAKPTVSQTSRTIDEVMAPLSDKPPGERVPEP